MTAPLPAHRILTMPCRHSAQLISESLDRPLRFRERLALRIHLLYCTGCRRFRTHLALMRRWMRIDEPATQAAAAHPLAHLSATARARIEARIDEELLRTSQR